MTPRRCLIAAGGTGGHIFPARAAADALIARGWQVRLVTDTRGLRHAADFPAVAVDEIHAASPSTKNPVKLAKAALELTQGLAQTRGIVQRRVAKGGDCVHARALVDEDAAERRVTLCATFRGTRVSA